jgi:DNA-binding NtrC family response regulator
MILLSSCPITKNKRLQALRRATYNIGKVIMAEETSGLDARCEEAFAKVRTYAVEAAPTTARTTGRRTTGAGRFGRLFGTSPAMTAVYQMIEKVAPTDASVLLIGESGTGKELVANSIHDESPRRAGAFVAINCGAFSANLIEAELFGYERGAFTGAVRSHRGCFERATGGTLFLDEITEMPLELQIKLLRALETGSFYRVGGEQEMSVNVRIIAATNRDPNQAVSQNLLREDLLYRLAVFPLPLPPLRARGPDIELLAQQFLDELNAEAGTQKSLSASARAFLTQHSWPGNVRELKNAVQRAFIMGDAEVNFELRAKEAPAQAAQPAAPTVSGPTLQFAIGMPLADIERDVIMATLEHCRGRKRETAELLGVSLKTLYNRLNQYRGVSGANAPGEVHSLAAASNAS